MSTKFDVVIIGAGPGGTHAAIQLASQGKKVLHVEEDGKPGGTCLFVGCIPSKIIRHWADEYATERKCLAQGAWSSEDREKAWNQIRGKIKPILDNRSGGVLHILKSLPSLTFVAGRAAFISNNEVVVEEKDTGRKENYTFDEAIIATGSSSIIPPFKGNGVEDVLTSEVLFSQEKLPETLLIIGGGAIGVELAQMLAKLGVKCTIVELADSILHGVVDPESASMISDKIANSGIEIHTSSKVQAINKLEESFEVTFEAETGVERKENFENVLVVTGKAPNLEGLGLDSTDIDYDRKGITVTEYLESSVKGIYAIGDVVNGSPKFAHTATYEAHVVSSNIAAGNSHKVDYSKNSWVLFSEPEIASAGLTEAQAVKE